MQDIEHEKSIKPVFMFAFRTKTDRKRIDISIRLDSVALECLCLMETSYLLRYAHCLNEDIEFSAFLGIGKSV